MDEWIAIETIYRPVGAGCSKAIAVAGADGNDYVAKGPTLVRNFRHVATNEMVAAGLASKMKLPFPAHRILTRGKKLFFGSSMVADGFFHPVIDDDLFWSCGNVDLAYELVVFDAWICNGDRHAGNLWVLCSGGKAQAKQCKGRHSMLLIDHDRSLLPDNLEASYLSSLVSRRVRECVQLSFVTKAIISPDRLGAAIAAAEAVSNDDIAQIVNAVPPKLLVERDKQTWTEFLALRRDALRGIFEKDREFFYSLKAGAI